MCTTFRNKILDKKLPLCNQTMRFVVCLVHLLAWFLGCATMCLSLNSIKLYHSGHGQQPCAYHFYLMLCQVLFPRSRVENGRNEVHVLIYQFEWLSSAQCVPQASVLHLRPRGIASCNVGRLELTCFDVNSLMQKYAQVYQNPTITFQVQEQISLT